MFDYPPPVLLDIHELYGSLNGRLAIQTRGHIQRTVNKRLILHSTQRRFQHDSPEPIIFQFHRDLELQSGAGFYEQDKPGTCRRHGQPT